MSKRCQSKKATKSQSPIVQQREAEAMQQSASQELYDKRRLRPWQQSANHRLKMRKEAEGSAWCTLYDKRRQQSASRPLYNKRRMAAKQWDWNEKQRRQKDAVKEMVVHNIVIASNVKGIVNTCRKCASLESSARENRCQQQRIAQRRQNWTEFYAATCLHFRYKGRTRLCLCCNRLRYHKTVNSFQIR